MLRQKNRFQNYGLRFKQSIFLSLSLIIIPVTSFAQWATITSSETGSSPSGLIAFSENQEGYRLEIYKDTGDVVKGRFILKAGLLSFSNDICPTFQIDNGTARNTSIDGVTCLLTSGWSEYTIGKVLDNRINSSVLVALMEGITLTFRFRLANGDYRETSFSLNGSKRSLTVVIGVQVLVNEI